ncbi:MAG: hypothetical protein KGZ58_12970 [Ignavibacteriales bacterium]|nr:hypothetical protein [Ignavibacteriales bacterium]
MALGTLFYRRGNIYILSVFVFFSVILLGGCDEPTKSPQPGILEVRLKSVVDTSGSFYFSPTVPTRHIFTAQLKSLSVYRDSRVFFEVYGDIRSTRRYASIIDLLAHPALDSALVLGQSYAPPEQYLRLNFGLNPAGFSFYNGNTNVPIRVLDKRSPGEEVLYLTNKLFRVQEGRKTIVTISINIDSSMTRSTDDGEDVFLFSPKVWISSVIIQ